MTTHFKKDLKLQLQQFGLNPKEWVLKGPYPYPIKSKAQWQGLFIHKDEPSFQIFGLWRPNGLLELSTLG